MHGITWRTYILLTRVERAFRDMKTPLMQRPIFHELEHRIQTHIFLCVLAYHLLVAIEKYFLDEGIPPRGGRSDSSSAPTKSSP